MRDYGILIARSSNGLECRWSYDDRMQIVTIRTELHHVEASVMRDDEAGILIQAAMDALRRMHRELPDPTISCGRCESVGADPDTAVCTEAGAEDCMGDGEHVRLWM